MKSIPSIFNDVLGPVMRGPSSSHSAAALRIGRIARDLMAGDLTEVVVEYDPSGALVTTHDCQSSDLGLFGGLMGWETDDARLTDFREERVESLAGGSFEQEVGAASMALQNSLGMTCDTLANRVEAPCLGRNVTAASNALSSANMALADYLHLVPFDQVVDAMREVGDMMPRELCCTGLGGLAITPASREIEKKLCAGKCAEGCESQV